MHQAGKSLPIPSMNVRRTMSKVVLAETSTGYSTNHAIR
jgi:hypothetical protein